MSRHHIQSPRNNLSDSNAACHGWTGNVPNNGNETMGTPKVFVIYWGDYFVLDKNDFAVDMLNQYISMLIVSPYMDGLNQYGINRGVFLGSFSIGSSQEIPENPMSENQLVSHLKGWIDRGNAPKPDSDHYDSLYIVFTPQNVTLTHDGLTSATDFSGYHGHGHYGQTFDIGKENLFYAALPWPQQIVPGPASPADLVLQLSQSVSHEMVEAFTDRNDNGWFVGVGDSTCELCDICERSEYVSVFSWSTSKYWSNGDFTCFPSAPMQNYLIVNSANQLDVQGLPQDPLSQIEAMQSVGVTFLNAAFPPGGGWIVIGANNWYFASGIPQDAFDQIGNMVASGNVLLNVVFPPSGGWLIIGEDNYYFASGIPQDTFDAIGTMVAAGYTLQNVAFSPSGGWIVICQDNQWTPSENLPVDIWIAIEAFLADGGTLSNIVFFPNWSALIIGIGGDYRAAGAGFPPDVAKELSNFVPGPNLATDEEFIQGSQLTNLVVGLPQ